MGDNLKWADYNTEAIKVFKGRDWEVSKATINSLELVYEVPHPEAETTYVIPVYELAGTFTLSSGDVVSFSKIVPAVPQEEIKNWVRLDWLDGS